MDDTPATVTGALIDIYGTPFNTRPSSSPRSFADRVQDEIRALAAERRQQIVDDMRHGAPTRPSGTEPRRP